MEISFAMTKEQIGKAANIMFIALAYKWKTSLNYIK